MKPRKPRQPVPKGGEIILYQTEDGQTRIDCRFEEGTIWLTQAQIAELFQTTPQNVTLHLKAIFAESELAEAATCKDYLQVRQEGTREVSRNLCHYRLEAILAVGFRVRSQRGTQFRRWATAHLEEYLRKGFVMDDERLKNPPGPGEPDYFDELLERIFASEYRLYLPSKEDLRQRLLEWTQSEVAAMNTDQIGQPLVAQLPAERIRRNLSVRLTQELGKGFTETNLKYIHQFYFAFPAQTASGNGHTPCDQLHQSICA